MDREVIFEDNDSKFEEYNDGFYFTHKTKKQLEPNLYCPTTYKVTAFQTISLLNHIKDLKCHRKKYQNDREDNELKFRLANLDGCCNK